MYVIDYPLTSIETLDGPVPQGTIIARETLDLMREQSRNREQWLAEAKACRDAAMAERERAQADSDAMCAALLEAARVQSQQQAAQCAEDARREVIAHTLDWLVDEASMERATVHSLERRIADALIGALSNFVATLDVGERFAHRVANTLPSLVREGALVLRVPPAHHEAVATALQRANIVLACTPDTTLTGRHARLESEWVTLCLDLDADLAAVVERLRVAPSLEVAYG
ncbi:hypothetical protein [Pandoraea norimbergensis]|uniref:Type III secretion system protein n=1 Tax=Pandoraea norimbergensis TaxID=93219 RepID=A0ABN4JI37_9BURK|nr:hypothetical protein [Pandoraea norimbergensis]ALS60553.1 hypothetical protein AT302_12970 [Pandoraea norimbergensis]